MSTTADTAAPDNTGSTQGNAAPGQNGQGVTGSISHFERATDVRQHNARYVSAGGTFYADPNEARNANARNTQPRGVNLSYFRDASNVYQESPLFVAAGGDVVGTPQQGPPVSGYSATNIPQQTPIPGYGNTMPPAGIPGFPLGISANVPIDYQHHYVPGGEPNQGVQQANSTRTPLVLNTVGAAQNEDAATNADDGVEQECAL